MFDIVFEMDNSFRWVMEFKISGIFFVKFIYSEKAIKFWEISIVDLSYVVPVKSMVEILQNFVAF